MKAAAIYARVSTADQVDGTSLDSQVKTCREFAARQNYNIVEGAVIQEDISGTTLNRPGLAQIIEKASRKEINTLIVSRVDRLARSRLVSSLLRSELKSCGIELVFVDRDTSTSQGRLLVNIEDDFAEWEHDRILERTWEGKVERASAQARDPSQGIMAGRCAPYGYRFVVIGKRTTRNRTVPIHGFELREDEADWVRRIFEWVALERCTLHEVERRLNAHGVPTKDGRSYWHRATLRELLVNSIYIGDWCWGKTRSVKASKPRNAGPTAREKSSHVARPPKEWIHIPSPRTISDELFEAAQRQLQLNKAQAGRPSARKYLLRGMLHCTYCGMRLCGSMTGANRRTRPVHFYKCPGHSAPGKREVCRCPYPGGQKLERELWEQIAHYLANEDVLFALIREREAGRDDESTRDQARLAAICQEEETLKRKRRRLAEELLADPPIIDRETATEYAASFDKQATELQAARAEIEERMRERHASEVNEAEVKQMCRNVRERLPFVTEDDKRAWLEVLDVRGTVAAGGIHFTWIVGAPFTLLLERQAAAPDGELYSLSR